MMRQLVTFLVVLMAATGVAKGQTHLPANAGFEQLDPQGFAAGWERWPAASPEPGAVSIDSAVAHSGERSLRVHHEKASSYTRGQQAIRVAPNQRYYFRVWMKGEGIDPAEDSGSMGARLYVEGIGGRDHATERATGSFGWTQYAIGPFDSRQGGTITVMCYLHHTVGTVWFDDVEVILATPDFERRLGQERVHRRFAADLRDAQAAAEAARDAAALKELQRLAGAVRAEDLPDRLDFRAGAPYFPAHATLFRVMASVNARRLPGKALAAWVDDPFAPLPMLGLAPRSGNPAASVVMGVGERDQAAITLCNLGKEPLRLRVVVEGLGRPGAPVVTLREVAPVESRSGEMLADALPRLRAGATLDLPPGVFRQLWLDVSSRSSKPGTSRGKVRLLAPGGKALEVPLTVEVLSVALPDPLPIVTWNYSYDYSALVKDRWAQARADLAAHHINAYCWPSRMVPWPKFDDSGKLLPLDWTTFDAGVRTHDNIQRLLLWPGFEWDDNLKLRQGLEVGSPLWEERFVTWFRALQAGLRERGFGHDRIAWYLTDEPTTARRVAQTVAAGQAIRKADPQALIVENPYSACTKPLLEQMAPVVDIWCPELSWGTGSLLPFFRQHSKSLWSYQVLGRHAPAFERYRLSFWECFQHGITGQGFWAYAECGGSNWNPYDAPDADYAVVYDGDPEELVPSKRWEAWREGVEDYTYLHLLREREGERAAALLDGGVDKLLAKPSPAALAALRQQVLRRLARTRETPAGLPGR